MARQPPKWAIELLARVAADEGREDIPELRWKYTESWGSGGMYVSSRNQILVSTVGGAEKLKQSGRLTLLHEIAHWLADKRGHSPSFWDKAWELYHRYGVDIEYARVRERWYRRASVAAYQRYVTGEKYEEWRPKGDSRPIRNFEEGDYVVLQPDKRYGRRSWYYGWVVSPPDQFKDTEGRIWYLDADTEAWSAKRRVKEMIS